MGNPQGRRVSVRNESSRRLKHTLIRTALETLLTAYEVPPAEVSVLLADDERLRELNRDFRQIDEATDVLTFPSPKFEGAPLGDIAISVEFAARQAANRGVSTSEEAAFLAIHGGLHLLGFDDLTDDDRREMVRRMNEVAIAAGLHEAPDWTSLPHEGEG